MTIRDIQNVDELVNSIAEDISLKSLISKSNLVSSLGMSVFLWYVVNIIYVSLRRFSISESGISFMSKTL